MARLLARFPQPITLLAALALAGCGTAQSLPPTAVPPQPTAAAVVPRATTAPPPTMLPTTAPPTREPATETAAPTVTTEAPTLSPTLAATQEAAPALDRALRLREPRMEGDDVRVAQERLVELGFEQVGTPDGIYGPATEAAVRAFQQRRGLDVDGIIGQQTWASLFATAEGADVAPIIHARTGFLLGGASGGAWLTPEAVAASLGDGRRFRMFSAAAETGMARGAAPRSVDVPCPETLVVSLSPVADPADVVAFGGDWDPLPRIASPFALDDPALIAAVAETLRAEGLAQPEVQLTQALRVDLEGDGRDEVLVSASRLAEPRTTIAAGDYSVILIVRADGSVTTVASEWYDKPADFGASVEHRIAGLLDLNGDGTLELLSEWGYYEGGGASVYQITEQQATAVLGASCGV